MTDPPRAMDDEGMIGGVAETLIQMLSVNENFLMTQILESTNFVAFDSATYNNIENDDLYTIPY